MNICIRFNLSFLAALLLAPAFCLAKTNAPPPRVTMDQAPLAKDVKAATSFAPIVKKVAPSVVTIDSTITVKESGRGRNPFADDPLLRRFFGPNDDPGGGESSPRERRESGLGSGVIISPDGYILTANHVVENADRVKVTFASEEKQYDAKVVGNDPPTDVAILKIDAKRDLPAITLGDSDKLEVGDTVLAVGNPFSVGQTVTMGVVSALERGFGMTAYENFIQTDAAINPGNSGGALVDAQGRLVGINTAILSRSGGFMGVGFAVPINIARFVADRLVTEGKVSRGYLGINIQPLTPDLARLFHLPDESSGILVGGVTPDSSADKAGVKDGDVVTEFNGKKVTNTRNFRLLVAQTPPGTKVNLRVLRGEGNNKPSEKMLSAKLGEFPREYLVAGGSRGDEPRKKSQSATDALDGVEVADLDSRTRRQTGIPNSIQGALVTNVDQDSNAAEAGLKPGDVITEINRQAVKSSDDAVGLSEKATTDHILLRVWSAGTSGGPGGTHYLSVDNTKRK